MILSLLSLILVGACVPTSYGCPDYESQRAAELQDSLDDVAELQDSLDDARPADALHSATRPLSPLPTPTLVALSPRNVSTEPERATTCYVGLDCPEDRN